MTCYSSNQSKSDEYDENYDDYDYVILPQFQASTSKYFIHRPKTTNSAVVDFTPLSRMCDRYGVSDRAGAAIASSVLQSSTAVAEVIDKNKLRHKRSKTRKLTAEEGKIVHLQALYFDGRKNNALTVLEKDRKKYRRTIIKEHISLLSEPDSKFLGYIAPALEHLNA